MADEQRRSSLGLLVSSARKARALSLRELGARLDAGGRRPHGVSPQFLNDIEHDRRRPSRELAEELAAVLGLSAAAIEAAAGRGAAPVLEYLRQEPGAAEPVERLFRRARDSGWTSRDWERLLESAGRDPSRARGRRR